MVRFSIILSSKREALLLLLSFLAYTTFATPQAELWDYWDQSNPQNMARINHSFFQIFLDRYRTIDDQSKIAVLDYSSVSISDKNNLDSYISTLEAIEIRRFNKEEQFAYWVNLYNAATILLILENHSISSIRDIKPNIFVIGPWDEKILEVEGQELSLNDIEHRILRPIWRDFRIHFVVNCASLGCPNLPANVIDAEILDEQLNYATVQFVNHPRALDASGDVLQMSSIFDWYETDFGSNPSEVLKELRPYLSSSRFQSFNQLTSDGSVQYEYDWDLNEVK